MDTTTVYNWETQGVTPHLKTLPRIIEFLGYNPLPEGETIGERLRRYREGLGLSLHEAAQHLFVDPSTLWKWETGRREPLGKYFALVERFLRA